MDNQGFFASLFDVKFKSFVTTKIITILFILAMIVDGLYILFLVLAGFNADPGLGVVLLVLSPLFFLLGVIYVRVLLEFVIVVFRIYENTRIMAATPGPAAGGPGTARTDRPPPPPEGPLGPSGA